ncbi:hypothetical protein PCA31118_00008 [Pandoraea captiosa]|uniref:Phage tail assembly protein n=1 Tax=Pandoraea captiosa TaxID=2508302 RepID=A0A5E4ZGI8_9BURK|nr:hypothetical protein [Pandoraea captiosa]VVE59767.1 hypothetical protein PCA31118_00008 [Pandoraea captiosa]
MMTEQGSLEYGVEYPEGSGERHYDFEVRLATVADNIAVYEDPAILGGGVSNMRVNAENLARCLVTLGTIPKESITGELIGKLIDSDYDVLMLAQEALKKKLKRPSAAAATSDSPKSSSPATASPGSDSPA